MDTIVSLGSLKYTTFIDLNMGYNEMELEEEARRFTLFFYLKLYVDFISRLMGWNMNISRDDILDDLGSVG